MYFIRSIPVHVRRTKVRGVAQQTNFEHEYVIRVQQMNEKEVQLYQPPSNKDDRGDASTNRRRHPPRLKGIYYSGIVNILPHNINNEEINNNTMKFSLLSAAALISSASGFGVTVSICRRPVKG